MNCPKCKTPSLTPGTVGPLQVDQCPGCGGVWCDAAELPQLLALAEPALASLCVGQADPRTNARTGVCPRDGAGLLRVSSARRRQVIVESCPKCHGVWLDGGELAQLLAP